MSFIAGYLAGLEEGGSFKNEAVTFKSNGEYKPEGDVRWECVNVDVPQGSSGIMEIIEGLPVHASLELEDGYRIDFSVDADEVVPINEMDAEWSYWSPKGGGDITIYPSWRQRALMCFAKIYKDGNLLLAQYNTTNGYEYSSRQYYTASERQPLYLSSESFISDIRDMTVGVNMPSGRSAPRIVLEYRYKKAWYYYNSDGSLSGESIDDMGGMIYFNDISASNTYPSIITDLDFNEKAKALIGLHVAFIHTMGHEIKYDISNI